MGFWSDLLDALLGRRDRGGSGGGSPGGGTPGGGSQPTPGTPAPQTSPQTSPLPAGDIGWALSPEAFQAVANDIGVGAAEIWTVLAVETRGYGFLPNKLPLILFERHIFSRQTNGRFDAQAPEISNAQPGGYQGFEREYPRLVEASNFDLDAALRSASWGLGQVMGFNAENLGYASVHTMVATMRHSEDDQLEAFKRFIIVEGLEQPLRNHDWTTFARRYNGPNFAANNYHINLEAQFNRYRSGVLPDLDVRAAQLYLSYLDYNPYGIDGVMGSRTRAALAQFLTDIGRPTRPENIDRITREMAVALQDASDAIRDSWPIGGPLIA